MKKLAYVTEENATASQNKLKYFFTRDTLGRLLHMVDYTVATPKTYAYILDVHGNVTALADENGNRVVNYEYDAWGNLTNTPEGVMTRNGEYLRNANPFRYSSYQFDTESGLYYLKARYYTATLGRFLTRDALYELENGLLKLNQYIYCENNPVNYIDATGHASITTHIKKALIAIKDALISIFTYGVRGTVLYKGGVYVARISLTVMYNVMAMQANAVLVTPAVISQNYLVAVALIASIIAFALTAPGLFKSVLSNLKTAKNELKMAWDIFRKKK